MRYILLILILTSCSTYDLEYDNFYCRLIDKEKGACLATFNIMEGR